VPIWARDSTWKIPDGVRGAEHVVDGLILQIQSPQLHRRVVVFGDQVDGVADRREHPQAEQVELHQPDRGDILLVQLQFAG
jgi:hypothetical protein